MTENVRVFHRNERTNEVEVGTDDLFVSPTTVCLDGTVKHGGDLWILSYSILDS